MSFQVVDLLCDLVRIPSVNPMGRPVDGDEYYEHRVTDYVETRCRELGMTVERQPVAPRRDNLLALLPGAVDPRQGGRFVVLQAHQDTVPVDGMIIPPWTPERRDGKIFGRGSCDIKGGLACHLATLAGLAATPRERRPTVVLACTVNEEHGFSGAKAMAELWSRGQASGAWPGVLPEAVIVAEPTELDVVVAHKGIVRWKARTQGVASHSAMPERGDNAIYRMGHALVACEHYAQQVVGTLGAHPLVGRPTLSVGVISGGISVNTVPDACAIEIDRRLLPDEEPRTAQRHAVEQIAASLTSARPLMHDDPFIEAPGLRSDGNGALAERLAALAGPYGGGRLVGVPYGTDAPFFAQLGAPTVVFGPGSIKQAHTRDEWIEVEQLDAACRILAQFVADA